MRTQNESANILKQKIYDLYVHGDTLMLADAFENLREIYALEYADLHGKQL